MNEPVHRRHLRVINAVTLVTGQQHTPHDWGPWRLDPTWHVLQHADPDYEIDLETCTTPARTLDWIMQISGKVWADHATIAGLVRALDDLLHPQTDLCPAGTSRRLSRAKIRRSVTAAAKAVPLRHLVEDAR